MFAQLARAALTAVLAGPVLTNAYWILNHGSLTHDRLDPLVSPGMVSSHVHTIVGGSAFGPTVTNVSLQTSKCTTSPVGADLSNYWAPQLYYKNQDNGSYTLIPIISVNTYYLNRDGPTQKTIKAFPKGLRMLAGNMYRTAYNASNVADLAVSFVCLDYDIPATGNMETFPTTNCKDGLRAQIDFPSCWDGQNLDSADHQSHMSYPIGGAPDTGDCPESHPVKLMTLFNEWIFNVGLHMFPFVPGRKNWVFSFGDDTGLGMHADFINGWDQDVLEAAVEQCTGNIGGNLQFCPPFQASLDADKVSSCNISSVVDEDTEGPLKSLPGCNPVPIQQGAKCPGLSTPAIKGYNGSAGTGSSTTASVTASPDSSASPASSSDASSASSSAASLDSSSAASSASSSSASSSVASSTLAASSSIPSATPTTASDASAGTAAMSSASASDSPTPSSTSSVSPSDAGAPYRRTARFTTIYTSPSTIVRRDAQCSASTGSSSVSASASTASSSDASSTSSSDASSASSSDTSSTSSYDTSSTSSDAFSASSPAAFSDSSSAAPSASSPGTSSSAASTLATVTSIPRPPSTTASDATTPASSAGAASMCSASDSPTPSSTSSPATTSASLDEAQRKRAIRSHRRRGLGHDSH